jgi:hypothetical protein
MTGTRVHTKQRKTASTSQTPLQLFQDIQEHGVDSRFSFALRWMCPIFKKKDKKEIVITAPLSQTASEVD